VKYAIEDPTNTGTWSVTGYEGPDWNPNAPNQARPQKTYTIAVFTAYLPPEIDAHKEAEALADRLRRGPAFSPPQFQPRYGVRDYAIEDRRHGLGEIIVAMFSAKFLPTAETEYRGLVTRLNAVGGK
jgi:hypothetical protein